MSIINGIDYGDLIFSKRHEINQKAYENYYSDNFNYKNFALEIDFDGDDLIIPVDEFDDDEPLSYNTWLGTESHRVYATKYIRKIKLEKINKSIL
jgi:hypothetical protein